MLTVRESRILEVLWKSASMKEIPGPTIELVNGLHSTHKSAFDQFPTYPSIPQKRDSTNESKQCELPRVWVVSGMHRIILTIPAD